MELKCLGTGSSGNCYALKDKDGNILLLDAGIPVKEIKIGINFQISNIRGALITHVHQDHAFAAKDLEKMGVKIIAPYISKPKDSSLGPFVVRYFALTDKAGRFTHSNADGSECPVYGYIIMHDKEPLKMVYITDTSFVMWRFTEVNTLLIGINYMDELAKDTQETKKRHILSGHMELKTGAEFIKVTDRDKTLKNVIVGHLSEENSDRQVFENKIRKVTESNIYFARKGAAYELC